MSKIVRLIPLKSFELTIIYLKKCAQRGLKKCDYKLFYGMNMDDNNYITTLPKRGLKTSSYKMNMNKKDLKRLSKSQLIKLLIKQEKDGQANEFENSVASQSKQEESVSHKSVNDYEDLIIEPPEQF